VVTAVAGVSFRQTELRDVVEGDVLQVVVDDENPHDANAVAVRTLDGTMLGFIPKALAPRLRATGATSWPARIKDVLRGETWGLRVEILPVGSEVSSPRTRLAAAIERGRGPQQVENNPDSVSEEETTAADVPAQVKVLAPSGRFLGLLLRKENDRVIAVNDGVEVSFPAASVTLRS
jgi:hypothetical protein